MTHSYSRCKCAECGKVRKVRRLQYERGVRRLFDAAPVRRRLAELHGMGITDADVALVTGIAERTIYMISAGRTAKVHVKTYDAIINFDPDDTDLVRNEKVVDATASRLRVQALVALGYRQSWIAQELGRKYIGLDIGERITRRRALDILELCRRVGDTEGPSWKAAVQARNKGWRKPIEYDEDCFYDPHWDGIGGLAETESMKWGEQVLEDYDFVLRTCGGTPSEIAERLGVKVDTLNNLLRKREKRQAA